MLAATTVLAAESDMTAARTWRSADGETIVAEFVKSESGTVHLKTADGRIVTIGLSLLCKEDQAFARELSASQQFSMSGLKRPDESKTLTEDEINALQTEWTNPETGNRFAFYASFDRRHLRYGEKKNYLRSRKIPVRLIASLYEYKGARKRHVLNTKCRFYILDHRGNVIAARTMSLEQLRPIRGGGGYWDEVDKEGTYTAVIWTEKLDVTYGRKLTVKLEAVE